MNLHLKIGKFLVTIQSFWLVLKCPISSGHMRPVSAAGSRRAGAEQWLSLPSRAQSPPLTDRGFCTWTRRLPCSCKLCRVVEGIGVCDPDQGFWTLTGSFTTIVMARMGRRIFSYFVNSQHEVFLTLMALERSLEFSYWDS